jgi:hypothetical protein
VNLDTQFNTCVGYLRGKEDGLKMPRMAQQDKNGIIYISDMGGWSYTGGTIWALQISQNTQGQKQTQLTNLFPSFNLTMPHGLIIDPEGRVYVGTPKGIYRFQPTINGKIQINPPLELVTQAFTDPKLRVPEYTSADDYNGLEKSLKNKHPLVQMVANSDFSKIYLNVGAPSDDCTKGYVTKKP